MPKVRPTPPNLQKVAPGALVTLDGSGSTDANGDTLTYAWTLTSSPTGSATTLNSPTSVKPTFTPDLAGTYVASLTVNDGKVASISQTVTITAVSDLSQLFQTSSSRAGMSINGYWQPGSQFSSSITNNSNETFSLAKFEFQNNGTVIGRSVDLDLLSGGTLTPNESVGIVFTLGQSTSNNGFKSVYYLTLTRTGQQFTVGVDF